MRCLGTLAYLAIGTSVCCPAYKGNNKTINQHPSVHLSISPTRVKPRQYSVTRRYGQRFSVLHAFEDVELERLKPCYACTYIQCKCASCDISFWAWGSASASVLRFRARIMARVTHCILYTTWIYTTTTTTTTTTSTMMIQCLGHGMRLIAHLQYRCFVEKPHHAFQCRLCLRLSVRLVCCLQLLLHSRADTFRLRNRNL